MDGAVRHVTTPTGVNEGLVGEAKVLVVLEKGEEVVVAVGGKVGGVQVREQLFWIRQFGKQIQGGFGHILGSLTHLPI